MLGATPENLPNRPEAEKKSFSELCAELQAEFQEMLKREVLVERASGLEHGLPMVIAAMQHAESAFLEVERGNIAGAAGHSAAAITVYQRAISNYFPPHLSELIESACDEDFANITYGLEELLKQNWEDAHDYFRKAVIGFRAYEDDREPELLSDWGRDSD